MAELTIAQVLAVPATAGYFADDQVAIKAGAPRDGLAYPEGVRIPAEAVSVLLVLSDGHVAHGDCVSVQYSGVGGREPRLRAHALAAIFDRDVAPRLRGTAVTPFRPAGELVDGLAADVEGFGAAASYGLSQALLDAAAHRAGRTMADVIHAEWGLSGPLQRVPVFAQTGEERHSNVDKMILKRVDSLPHGLINAPALVGENGAELVEYVGWVRDRIEHLRASEAYAPILHFDVYGLIGHVCGGDRRRVADIVIAMAEAARPFALRVEHPLDAGSRDAQIRELAALRGLLAERAARVEIVADEWANTVEDIRAFNRAHAADVVQIKAPDLGSVHHTVDAVLDCRAHGVVAHLGGSCCETERSAQVSVQLALGAHADQLLAKPGMGVDEGLSIVRNEMQRTLALSAALDGTDVTKSSWPRHARQPDLA
jgi:methylaspartate ammonia-lyase